MSVPNIISIDNINYYDAKELYAYDKVYFYGCSKSIKTIIKKKNIDTEMYMYASFNKKKGWTIYGNDGTTNKSKLLLKEEWVINNVPKMSDEEVKYDIEEAPPRLYLEEHELFMDEDSNFIDVEVYGEREHDKCFFRGKSISDGFNIPNLRSTLRCTDSNYRLDIDFKIFVPSVEENFCNQQQKELYLTYEGLLRVLFVTRNNRTRHFRKWATKTLFAAQMGTDEQRIEVATNITSHIDEVRKCLKASTQKMSCVYFLKLGIAKDLRDIFKIKDSVKDNYLVCKFGKGIDLEKRLAEHENDYGKIEGVNVELIKYAYIDPKFITTAELDVSHFFNVTENKLLVDRRKEIFYINPKNLKFLESYIVGLQNVYIGSYNEQVQEVEKYKDQIANLKIMHQKDLEIKDMEIKNRGIIIEMKDMEIDNMRLKNLLLTNNITI
jgi:hypothetical protein